MSKKFNLNLNWYFKPSFDVTDINNTSVEGFEKINLPHTVKELSYNCFSHEETAMVSTYMRKLTIPQEYAGRRAILVFDGVMARYELYVNGQKVTEHRGGYSRSFADITKFLGAGENTIVMMVDSTENPDIPPFGHTIDYLCFGGIYRDVNLYLAQELWIENVLVRYDLNGNEAVLYPEIQADNAGAPFDAEVTVELRDQAGGLVKHYTQTVSFAAGHSSAVMEKVSAGTITRWDMEEPCLYTVLITVKKDASTQDTKTVRVGFRTVECRADGFFLNGKKHKLMGLNRHQSYPYIGYAAPARVQKKDADILKNYLHLTVVRTSHYMQAEEFLDRCDELGLMVFSEIPGWGYIGGEEFKQVSYQDVRDMITTQFNHPSIFIWSIRINESADDDEFYTKTNEIAKSIDTTRATTGTRCIKNSHLIEDVYTYNDFIHWTHEVKHYRELVLCNQQAVTGLDHKVPFLVSEYCGHIYPPKPFDGEERQLRHAQIHARVQNANFAREDALGAIGWCAFDYQTHGDYGSGDKICYHGVMSMFRTPKYAAGVYRSQVDPEKEIVLEPCTLFARGENDDNKPIPFMVCTNADYIDVEAYGRKIGRYFPSQVYSSLAHPPIMVDNDPGHWADLWKGGAIIAYYKGKEVARRTYSRDAHLDGLKVTVDDSALNNTVVDSTRFVCEYQDQMGNLLPYYNGIISVETSDNIEVIGPTTIAVVGGRIGFWVKTKPFAREEKATVTIHAVNTSIPDQVFTIDLSPDTSIEVLP